MLDKDFGGPTHLGYKNLRFSPVWLYMCVWRELGLVNRLSQTLHLCFFCVLEETLELNWLIKDCGAGGTWLVMRFCGRGSALVLARSMSAALMAA